MRGGYNSRQEGENLTIHKNSFCLLGVIRNRMTKWVLKKIGPVATGWE